MGLETLAKAYLNRMNKWDSTDKLLRFIYETGMDLNEVDKVDVIAKIISTGVDTNLNVNDIEPFIERDLAILKYHTLDDYGGIENDREVFEG